MRDNPDVAGSIYYPWLAVSPTTSGQPSGQVDKEGVPAMALSTPATPRKEGKKRSLQSAPFSVFLD